MKIKPACFVSMSVPGKWSLLFGWGLFKENVFALRTCALWACRGYRRGRPTCSRDLWLGSIQRRPDRTAHTGRGWAGTHPPWSPQTTTAADERKRRGGKQGSNGRGLQSEKIQQSKMRKEKRDTVISRNTVTAAAKPHTNTLTSDWTRLCLCAFLYI